MTRQPPTALAAGPALTRQAGRLSAGIGRLRDWASRRDLLAAFTILSLLLLFLPPDVWLARSVYNFVVLPLAILTIRRDELLPVLRSPVFLLTALYLGILVLATALAPDVLADAVADSVRKGLLVLSFLIIVACLAGRDEAFAHRLFLFLGCAVAVVAALNMVAYYGFRPSPSALPHRLLGIPGITNIFNPNPLGGVYAIAAVGIVATALHPRSGAFTRLVGTAAAAILVVAVLFTQSRGAFLAVAAGLCIAVVLGFRRHPRLLLTAGIIGVLAVIAAWPLLESFVARGDNMRFIVWRAYWPHVEARPWLGHGLSTAIQVTLPDGSRHVHAHNIVYSALVMGGVFAAAALAGALVAAVAAAVGAWRRHRMLLPAAMIATAVVATAVDYGMYGSEMDWEWLILWLPLGLCIAAGLTPASRRAFRSAA